MTLLIDASAINRINDLRAAKAQPGLMLRVRVEGGGCSGFQYKLDLTDVAHDNDVRVEDVVLTDDISMPFLDGATVLFEESLIGAEFKINNPNAKSGCGCGTSFSII